MSKEAKIQKAISLASTMYSRATLGQLIDSIYPILAEIEEPTEKEIAAVYDINGIICARSGIETFARNRNAALQEKKDPRIEGLTQWFRENRHWPDTKFDDLAVRVITEIDRIAERRSSHD